MRDRSLPLALALVLALQPLTTSPLRGEPPSPSVVQAPVLKWTKGGCVNPGFCRQGWYSSPAVADLDNDGAPDIVWGSEDVVAVRGDTGALKWRGTTGSRVWPGIAVADLTGNGSLEVIVGRNSNTLQVYAGVGSGNVTPLWTRNPFPNGEVRTLAVEDLESDGQLEIVVGRGSGGSFEQLSVYDAAGNVRPGWPARRTGEPGFGWGMYNENVAIGDLNNDGFKEVFGPTDTHYITVLDRNGNQLPVNAIYGAGEVWSQAGVHVDHAADIVGFADCGTEHRPNFANSAPVIADMDGNGSLEFIVPGDVYDCAIGDPDGDLYHMPWILNLDRTRWVASGFDWMVLPTPEPNSGPLPNAQDFGVIQYCVTNLVTADLDGDGKREMLYPSYDGRLHALWLDKTEHGNWPYDVPGPGLRFASEPAVVDIDNDGHAEVIFTSWGENASATVGQLIILDYLGNLLHAINLPAPADAGEVFSGALGCPTVANIDADAELEVVVGTTGTGLVTYDLPGSASARVLWGTGRGSYKRTGLAPPAVPIGPAPPNVTPAAGLTRVQGAAGTSSQVATVSDNDTAAGSLTVALQSQTAGLTVTNLTNTGGNVTATIGASCTATSGSFTIRVTDAGALFTDAVIPVTVTANPAPTVGTYPTSAVTVGGGTTVTPTSAPSDNVSVASVTASAPGFTGTLSGNPTTGVITVSNAGPLGPHTVTVTVTDSCGTTFQRPFTLNVNPPNTAPQITPSGISRQRGSQGTSSTVATVTDAETAAGSLTVTLQSATAGLTVTNVTNTAGTVTATVSAACGAATGSFTLRVTDGGGLFADGVVAVTVNADAAPAVGTYPTGNASAGGGTTVTPNAAPSDNGGVASVTASSTTFTGGLSGSASTGVITVTNANPPGAHTVDVTVTDNCGLTFLRSFVLNVSASNTTPQITPSGITRQRGSPGTSSTVATVADAETAAGSLTVTLQSATAGLTVTNLSNAGGSVTATVSAACGASTGSFTLRVTDGGGLFADGVVAVTVTADTAPSVGTYATANVGVSGGTTVTPNAAPSDNGSVASVNASAPGFTGTLSGSPTTGAITVSNANPPGAHTVTVTVTDNCGLTVQRTFTLNVTASNTAPQIATFGITRQQGSAATASSVATVSDAETSALSLTVTLESATAGLTVTNVVNGGFVSANVAAACGAASGSFTLRVSDGSLFTDGVVPVTVTANTAPALGTYPAQSVVPGGATTVNPSVPPSDNGGVATLTATSPTFTGTLTGTPATGAVSVTNAGPLGAHTVTVTATDACGAVSSPATFTLTVTTSNTPPSITAGGSVSRARGSSQNATIATVSDAQTAAGSLVVTTTSVPTGLSVTGIVNTNGTVTANVGAACTATLGATFIGLQASDGQATSNANLNVTVTPNGTSPVVTPPTPSAAVVNQTACVGGSGTATLQALLTRFPSQHADLMALLDGGSATDDCTASPTRLPTRLAGADITATTAFPVGTSIVTIRYQDADGNEGSTIASVVVRRQGNLDLDGDVDVTDSVIMANFIVGNVLAGAAPFLAPSTVADCDGDGDVDLFDLVTHMSYIVGNVSCLTP